jgi:hypothetical protein
MSYLKAIFAMFFALIGMGFSYVAMFFGLVATGFTGIAIELGDE